MAAILDISNCSRLSALDIHYRGPKDIESSEKKYISQCQSRDILLDNDISQVLKIDAEAWNFVHYSVGVLCAFFSQF